jgi:phage gpG-like protein
MPIELGIEGLKELEAEGQIFASARQKFLNDLGKAAQTYAMDSVARIKDTYLSGPRPRNLGVVSGRLRSSITKEVTTDGESFTITEGSNVSYAAIHELGFSGSVQVPAHQRVVKKVFGRTVPGGVRNVSWVGAHSMKMNMPARPFLNPGMRDALPAFEGMIQKALLDVVIGGERGTVSQ